MGCRRMSIRFCATKNIRVQDRSITHILYSFCASKSAESRRFNINDQRMRSQLRESRVLVYRKKARSGMAPATPKSSGIIWKTPPRRAYLPSAPRSGTPPGKYSYFSTAAVNRTFLDYDNGRYSTWSSICLSMFSAEKQCHTKSAPKEQPRMRDDTIPP